MKKRTGILDTHDVEICEGDIIKSEVGNYYEIFWDEDKQSLMARLINEIDAESRKILQGMLGEHILDPVPFQETNNSLAHFDIEIVTDEWNL